jgi:hypothetical protein
MVRNHDLENSSEREVRVLMFLKTRNGLGNLVAQARFPLTPRTLKSKFGKTVKYSCKVGTSKLVFLGCKC